MATANEIRDAASAKYRRGYDRLYVESMRAGSAEESAAIDEKLRMLNLEYEAAKQEADGLDAAARAGTDWCRCGETEGSESYYRRENGRHGWFHDPEKGGCGGITQTG